MKSETNKQKKRVAIEKLREASTRIGKLKAKTRYEPFKTNKKLKNNMQQLDERIEMLKSKIHDMDEQVNDVWDYLEVTFNGALEEIEEYVEESESASKKEAEK